MIKAQVVREGDKAIVLPAGDIVAVSSVDLRPALRELVNEGVRELVLDMVNVQMVDSSGLGLLIAAHNSLAKAGGRLQVIHASNEILDLFRSMRVHQHFSVSGN